MNVRKAIQKQFRRKAAGVDVVGGVNAAVAANVNEPGRSRTSISSRQRIVQRSGPTEERAEKGGMDDGGDAR